MEIINKAIQFLKEVYNELKKVNWLSKKEIVGSTIVVIAFILITALYVGAVDFVLSKILGVLLGAR